MAWLGAAVSWRQMRALETIVGKYGGGVIEGSIGSASLCGGCLRRMGE